MEFEIGTLFYIVITIVAIIVAILGRIRRRTTVNMIENFLMQR